MSINNTLPVCDIHSHLLPGIDDGSDSWPETMKMLRTAYAGGVRTIIATPHFLPWEEHHNTDKVGPLCGELRRRAREEEIPVTICAGQELYYYDRLLEDLDSGQALTLAGTRYVLVEFSEEVSFEDVRKAVIRLTRGGYRPVIAHFERFGCLRREHRVREIKELGAGIQSNIHAIQRGRTGWTDYRWLRRQYKEQVIDFTGSDMHNTSSRPPIVAQDLEWFEKNLPQDYLRRLMYENAGHLLENRAKRAGGV